MLHIKIFITVDIRRVLCIIYPKAFTNLKNTIDMNIYEYSMIRSYFLVSYLGWLNLVEMIWEGNVLF